MVAFLAGPTRKCATLMQVEANHESDMRSAKAPMRDTTFIIPFCLDTPSRLTNLDTVLTFLVSRLDTTVIV